MKQILGRFFYSGGQGQPGIASVPLMAMWKDPLEGAFTCPVPQGWKVEGGLKRFSLGDVRPEVWAVRPDNQILVRIGDSFIPPMTLPTQLGMQYGFVEGQWEGGVFGTKMLVMRYLPSTFFLTDFYLPQRVGQVSNVQARNLPQKVSQAWGQKVLIDIGEITFDAQTEMGFRKGYAFVKTTMMPASAAGVPGGGYWNVETFHGYLAEPKAEPLAQAILKRMAEEYQIDPNWDAQQKQAMFKAHNIARKSQQDTFDIINRTYSNRSRSQDLMNENWSRAYRGEVLIQDPTTGQKYEVPAGSNYYFRIGSENQFIGTDTSTAPYSPNHWLREMRILN